MKILGVDTGGTFTDFALLDGNGLTIHKVLSTPAAPEQAILQGVDDLNLANDISDGKLFIIHGTTVATNAALEKKGARTVYITNRGFSDILTIGRQTRKELYNLQPQPIEPPVPQALCLETGGRLSATGEILEPLTEQDINDLLVALEKLKPESVAINLLFSFLDPEAEMRIEQRLPKYLFTSRSSFVLPEYKEYERGMATWLNAWLGPIIQRYLHTLIEQLSPAPIAVMQSSGGTIDARQAASRAVNLLLSGPAGGLAATRFIGQQIDEDQFMTFDMGGTSTDVALIAGDITLTNEGKIGDYPVAVPMVDMHTIGAGGGSIAYIDAGGLLQVGPQSAGANPGPACYGLGGKQPTVTDANAVLGRLRPDAFLGGNMTLDIHAAREAIAHIATPLALSIEDTALGIIAIANEHMTQALRVISVQRGYNPASFRLCCFGGAGGLHVCAIANALGMNKALIPVHGGVLSALGMLVAPKERQLSKTVQGLITEIDRMVIEDALENLAQEGIGQLVDEGVTPEHIQQQATVDLRYFGQSYTLNLAWKASQTIAELVEQFHHSHQARFGHRLQEAVELVNVRQSLRSYPLQLTLADLPSKPDELHHQQITLIGVDKPVKVFERNTLSAGQVIEGPALITETISTTFVDASWQLRVDRIGNLLLQKQASL